MPCFPALCWFINETLALCGFISVTPDKPIVAFSFKLFEIYHQLHCVCPQFSFHALSTSLVHLHQVTIFFLVISATHIFLAYRSHKILILQSSLAMHMTATLIFYVLWMGAYSRHWHEMRPRKHIISAPHASTSWKTNHWWSIPC